MFLDELYPILRDLTHSIRQGDWHLFVSAVRRCKRRFGRTNYCRCGTLVLEDCVDIQRKFPGTSTPARAKKSMAKKDAQKRLGTLTMLEKEGTAC